MTEEELRDCKYVDQEMCFYTFDEFLHEAPAIKRQYNGLKHKIFYRWYVFAHQLSDKRKNAIWCYLNNDMDYEKLTKM